MEKYILDTNTWIEHFHRRNGVREHVETMDPDQLFVSEVTLAELTFGAYNSDDYERHIQEPQELRVSFNVVRIGEIFDEYAHIRCALKKRQGDRQLRHSYRCHRPALRPDRGDGQREALRADARCEGGELDPAQVNLPLSFPP